MEFSRRFQIENVIIKKEDITSLFSAIEKAIYQYEKGRFTKKYSIRFDNGNSIASEELSLFEDFPRQGSSRPLKIESEIMLQSQLPGEIGKVKVSIRSEMEHGDNSWGNSFYLSCDHQPTFDQLKNIIENEVGSFEPQKTFFKKKQVWSFLTLVLTVAVAFNALNLWQWFLETYTITLEGKQLNENLKKVSFSTYTFIFFCLVLWLPLTFFSDKAESAAKKTWPSVELALGESWKNKEERRRRFWSFFIAAYLFPVFLVLIAI